MSIVPTRGLEALSASLDALNAVPTQATLCTQAASVPVAAARREKGRLVLRMHTARGRARLAFVCQRSRRGSGVPTVASLQDEIFSGTCATASCHDAAAAGGLNLSEHVSFANLVGVPAANPAAQGAGRLRGVPGDPDQSFLLAKLLGQLAPGGLLDVNLPTTLLGVLRSYGIDCDAAASRGRRHLTNGLLAEAASARGSGSSSRATENSANRRPRCFKCSRNSPQARAAAYVVEFTTRWQTRPIEPVAGGVIEWP